MDDNDLIWRGDALAACSLHNSARAAENTIAALPAVIPSPVPAEVKLREMEAALSDAEAKLARVVEALRDVIGCWDWWQKDTYDRCQSVPSDAIEHARSALAELDAKGDK
jgi:hypothetical protein